MHSEKWPHSSLDTANEIFLSFDIRILTYQAAAVSKIIYANGDFVRTREKMQMEIQHRNIALVCSSGEHAKPQKTYCMHIAHIFCIHNPKNNQNVWNIQKTAAMNHCCCPFFGYHLHTTYTMYANIFYDFKFQILFVAANRKYWLFFYV